MDNIKEEILEILDDNGITYMNDKIDSDIDSIQYISTMVSIEEKFEIEIPESYLVGQSLDDISHLVSLVQALLNQKESEE